MNVFVYGTLMSGMHNNHLLSDGRLVGPATLPKRRGLVMIPRPGFPYVVEAAMIESEPGTIVGELWKIGPEALGRLDELEGVAHGHYRRAQATARKITSPQWTLRAWVYVATAQTTEMIKSIPVDHRGDWRAWLGGAR